MIPTPKEKVTLDIGGTMGDDEERMRTCAAYLHSDEHPKATTKPHPVVAGSLKCYAPARRRAPNRNKETPQDRHHTSKAEQKSERGAPYQPGSTSGTRSMRKKLSDAYREGSRQLHLVTELSLAR